MSLDPRLTFARDDLADQALQGQVEAVRFQAPVAARIVAPLADLRPRPDRAAGPVTQLLYGEAVHCLDRADGFAWVQADLDDYVGYVAAEALGQPSAASHRLAAPFSHAYARPDVKCPAPMPLYLGARLAVSGPPEQGFLPTDCGWVPERHLLALDDRVPVLRTARALRHSPYLWGGRTPAGLDCSALVQLAFALAGRDLPRDSDQQLAYAKAHGRAVDQAEAGDLAFFPGHVGIMLDSRTLLHANATAMAVSADPLEMVATIVGETEQPPFLGLYRLG